MNRHPNILNAASNLLGICFILITGLKLTGRNGSWADETAWCAALLLLASCILSYLAIRDDRTEGWPSRWADRSFLAGIGSLFVAVVIAASA
ncbi:hypothetical protein [Sandarakinorhabdus sp. DWP1-3-1]|uniref:hypothetical protein n=1 Tax=Sandarakinorhabdus sp. DWP1-3-1 TaxID=2804627 RepID=UPI003CFB1E7E